MADAPDSAARLVREAHGVLAGDGGLDVRAVRQLVARTAKALARALPIRDGQHDPDLDGLPMSPEQIKAAAIEARFFLERVGDLFGGPADPDWMGDDFACAGALRKRPKWKPLAKPTPAQNKRRAAAARVYDLMAEQCFDTGQPLKQEAAVAAVMQEFGLARSKVMQALKEYRSQMWGLAWLLPDDDPRDPQNAKALAHWRLACFAMEKERLRRDGPHDPKAEAQS